MRDGVDFIFDHTVRVEFRLLVRVEWVGDRSNCQDWRGWQKVRTERTKREDMT